jgi:hypothetical protein
MTPLTHIEALRLLARCRGTCGDRTGAIEALERAVTHARAVEYVYMERKALEDMLEWVEGDDAAMRQLKERLAKATSSSSLLA